MVRQVPLHDHIKSLFLSYIYINNLRYADDTTPVAESEEELKSHLMGVTEKSEKAGLKLNMKKSKTMASSSITSWQITGKKVEAVTFHFLELQNHWGQ